jgi:penicillin-binding protein 1A
MGPAIMTFETMTWAKRYKTEDLTGPEPEKPSDVVAPGDVIYVRANLPAEAAPETDQAEQADTDKSAEPAELPTVSLAQIPRVEGALISLDAQTGAIRALSGGYSFSQSKYNRAIQARRQPGSTFKPFLYLNALTSGMTPATIYNDAPIVFDDSELETAWRPQNSGGQFYGPTRLREALYRSRNLVSIRLLRDLGIQNTLDYLKQLQIPVENMPDNLSLSLGSGLLTPMELARGMAVIANGGYDVEPYLIESIRNVGGKIIYQAPKTVLCDENCDSIIAQSQPVAEIGEGAPAAETPDSDNGAPQVRVMRRLADERSVFILHSMMRDVIRLGTGRRALALGRDDIAGKTGTTNEQKDTWFAGFNHELATTTWVGFDQPAPLGRGEFGASTALPIWLDYMEVALEGEPPSFMPRPNGIVNIRINPETGQRARPGEEGVFEVFREEDAPPPLPSEEENDRNGSVEEDDLSRRIF